VKGAQLDGDTGRDDHKPDSNGTPKRAGPVLHIEGVKTLISWDRLVAVQLVED
jgi:hypothetical protein